MPGDPAIFAFLKGRLDTSLAIVDKRLAAHPFILGDRPTIADLSMCGYMYYPAEELGFYLRAAYANTNAWHDFLCAGASPPLGFRGAWGWANRETAVAVLDDRSCETGPCRCLNTSSTASPNPEMPIASR